MVYVLHRLPFFNHVPMIYWAAVQLLLANCGVGLHEYMQRRCLRSKVTVCR